MADLDRVAVIGVGRMGAAMARRLHESGRDLVLWNRDRRKAEAVAEDTGSQVADTPAEAAASAKFVLSSLADDAALEDVYLGEAGVAEGIEPGSVAVDTSTVDPETIEKMGRALDAKGVSFLDCPVSGSVSSVESGSLVVMAGGESEAVSLVEPLLSAVAKQVVHVGGRGAGAACKLAVNSLVHGINIALSEALVLAERAGVDREKAYEVFASGAGGAPFVHYKRDAFLHPENAVVAFTLDLVAKDLDLITALGRRVGAPLSQAEAGLGIVRGAIEGGLGGRDLSAVAAYLREERA